MNHMSTERQQALKNFLQNCFPFGFEQFTPIPGDASFRSYYRLIPGNKGSHHSYIIMDCPPTYCSIKPFAEIAEYLKNHGFSAPEIFHFDTDHGFIVLEDFGDLNLKNLLQKSQTSAKETYYSIIDLLVKIQEKTPPSNLQSYSNDLLLAELDVFIKWYVPYALGKELTEPILSEFFDIWQEILSWQNKFEPVLVLRDYHAENMMYLENRKNLNKFGLLDFQDAVIGCPLYDLVSMLEDARVEVPRDLARSCVTYFAKQKGFCFDATITNYHILGAQRNLRILGVFTRKLLRDKNDNYLKFLPLLWKYLSFDLDHKILADLKNWLLACKLLPDQFVFKYENR